LARDYAKQEKKKEENFVHYLKLILKYSILPQRTQRNHKGHNNLEICVLCDSFVNFVVNKATQ